MITLAQYAARVGRSPSSTYRDLWLLYVIDSRHGRPVDWFCCTGNRSNGRKRRIWINVSRLEAAHPERVRSRALTREQLEEHVFELQARVTELQEFRREDKKRIGAIGAGLREARGEIRDLREKMAGAPPVS